MTNFFKSLDSISCTDCFINQLDIIDNLPNPICIKNSNSEYIYANKAFTELTKYNKDSILGKKDSEIFPEIEAEISEKTDKEVLISGCDNINETDLTDANKKTYRVVVHKRLIYINQQKSILISITDITLRHHLEKELITLANTLENSIKEETTKRIEQERMMIQQNKLAAMGEMLGAIAHQWRQPLAIVGAILSNLQIGYDIKNIDRETFTKMLTDMEEQIQQMSSTINDFMNFFKPDTQKRYFSLANSVNRVHKLLKAQLENRGITFINKIPDKIKILGYKGQFEQVILNIVGNARDAFEDKKHKNKTIEIFLSEYSWKYDVVIDDNAGGIDEAIIHRIFEPYFTTKEEGKGTGLGLYMAKMIMQNSFNGDIIAQNITDKDGQKGARFILVIKKQEK